MKMIQRHRARIFQLRTKQFLEFGTSIITLLLILLDFKTESLANPDTNYNEAVLIQKLKTENDIQAAALLGKHASFEAFKSVSGNNQSPAGLAAFAD